MKRTIILLVFFLATIFPKATNCYAVETWAKTFGNSVYSDCGNHTIQTNDGGYITVGKYGDYGSDIWVLKFDGFGNIVWQKTYGRQGGTGYEDGYDIKQTNDGGYVVLGTYYSDIWVLKLSATGLIEWEKVYDDISGQETGSQIIQLNDGSYLIAGYYHYMNQGNEANGFLLKLTTEGDIIWQKSYNRTYRDYINSIKGTTDGGFVMCGSSYAYPPSYEDIWILKVTSDGNILWEKTIGRPSYTDRGYEIITTTDGGYLVAGATNDSLGFGSFDGLLIKFDQIGNVIWQKDYGDIGAESFDSVTQITDGSYIVVSGGYASQQTVRKLDVTGNIQWQKQYGLGSLFSLASTQDGGFIATGHSSQFSSSQNLWIAKFDSDGNTSGCIEPPVELIGSVKTIDLNIVNSSSQEQDFTLLAQTTGESARDPWFVESADCIPPLVSLNLTPNVLPAGKKGQMANVTVDGAASDNSGTVYTNISVIDEYGIYNMTVPDFGTIIQLEAWCDRQDVNGRQYTVTAIARDNAGNESTASVVITAPLR